MKTIVALPGEGIGSEADAVLFGAAGPTTSDVVGWLRWEMDAWGGMRPAKFFRGMRSPLADPDGIDLVVIRENSVLAAYRNQ